jgi:hypothetical protein
VWLVPTRQLDKLTDIHPNPTAKSAMNVSLAAQMMGHTAVSLKALVVTGKDYCTLCYELYSYSVIKKWLMRIMGDSFQSYCSQNQVVIKQTSFSSSFIAH